MKTESYRVVPYLGENTLSDYEFKYIGGDCYVNHYVAFSRFVNWVF